MYNRNFGGSATPAPPTFFWHDYETTGTHKQLDRPTQFAGIRTDMDLNPIGEPVMIYCQPSPEVLMHPMASLITGITPQECQAQGLIEKDFAAVVLQELGKPGTCGIGYNTISFDDEMSRSLFYRNFMDPYEREYKGNNSRSDLISIVRMVAALRPEGIVWPTKPDGRPSLRLEDLAKANGLKQDRAHDALSDVEATIALARLVRDKQPGLWAYALDLRHKAKVKEILNPFAPKPVVHVAGYYPAERGNTTLIAAVAGHPTQNNGIVAVDLTADLSRLMSLSAEDIAGRLFGAPTEDDEDGETLRLPVTLIQANKSPSIATIGALRVPERERLGYTAEVLERCQANLALIQATPALGQKLAHAYALSAERFPAAQDAELAIYQGFPSEPDKRLMAKVRAATPEQLAAGGFTFTAPKYNDLLFRYRARNWPASLTADEEAQWQAYRKTRLTEATPATSLTLADFRTKVSDLKADPAYAPKADLLAQLSEWGDQVERSFPAPTAPTVTPPVSRPRGP
jgi:exodeoxyribonuclease-1